MEENIILIINIMFQKMKEMSLNQKIKTEKKK